ncbi:MAG: hypothetical protein M1819_000471 [Sarea resinae]|nr:MAG: hypothetical protein M1819_000471 [Sarea resinae]
MSHPLEMDAKDDPSVQSHRLLDDRYDSRSPSIDDEDAALLSSKLELAEAENGKVQDAYKGRWAWAAGPRLPRLLRVLIVPILFGSVFVAALFFALPRARHDPEQPYTSADLCLDPACVHAASEILYNLSPTEVDPCTDFDAFVCDGWRTRHDLRPDQGELFTGTIMNENSQTLLRHVLERPYPAAERSNFVKLKDAYDACMNEDAIKEIGLNPLTGIVDKIDDLLNSEKSQGTSEAGNVSNVILYLTGIGVEALASIDVGPDDKDPDTIVISLSGPGSLGLPSKEYYEDEEVLAKHKDVVDKVITAVLDVKKSSSNQNPEPFPSFDPDSADLVDQERSVPLGYRVVEFEQKIAKASPNNEDANDITKFYNRKTVAEAQSLVPALSLSFIISNLAPAGYKPERLIVGFPEYLESVSDLISHTPRETIRGYFVWKVIQAYASKIEDESLKPLARFKNELQGKPADATEDRWRKCVREVDDGLGWILSRFFVQEAFSEEARQLGDRIVSDIRNVFADKLLKSDWMDKEVIKLAIEKGKTKADIIANENTVRNLVQKIGYPTKSPDIMNPDALKNYYATVNISPSRFFDNALSIASFDTKREWSALGKPTDRDRWGMTVPTVNAYYSPEGNEIVFPAGIMQFPVFDVAIPEYISYGSFGSISGHELSHAFDSTGRHYDPTGNLTDWWTPSTTSRFEQKASCFASQYANFTIPSASEQQKPLHVNGNLTLGENIADAGGVSAAFAAWKRREASNPDKNKLLPGLEGRLTREQLFFVAFGSFWCGKSTDEAARGRIYSDPHAPKWARNIGTMANSRDFKAAFNCPIKEPVCELW